VYCIIGLGVAGLGVFLGNYDADHEIGSDTQIRWIAAIVFTAFVFGFGARRAIEAKLRHPRTFWGLLSALAVVHGSLLAASAKITGSPPLSLFAIVAVAEIWLFTFAVKKCAS